MTSHFKNALMIYISLAICLFLLAIFALPALAGETVLNSDLSVNIPQQQEGNPGDFLTYVLSFQNRSHKPIQLELVPNTDSSWNVVCDSWITIPANTKNYYYPITVSIPNNAVADSVKALLFRFKDSSNNQLLPPIALEVLVNPVSAIDFSLPTPLQGSLGDIISYAIIVTNHGNTTEQFSVKVTSQNGWKTSVNPPNFSLMPDQAQTITINHQIPVGTTLLGDDLQLTIAWNSQHKNITLHTGIIDQAASLKDKFYIWNGQLSLSHPDITNSNDYRLGNSFSLQGQWQPRSWAQFYFSELFDSDNQTWFTNFKHNDLEVKAGRFWLSWEGLMEPQTADEGNLYLKHTLGNQSFAMYLWNADSFYETVPFAFEANLNENLALRYLYLSEANQTQNIFDLAYRHNFNPHFLSTIALAQDLSHSQTYGYNYRLENYLDAWFWNADYRYLHNYEDYRSKKNFQAYLAQYSSLTSTYGRYYFEYEGYLDTNHYDQYNLYLYLIHPKDYSFSYATKLNYIDSQRANNKNLLTLESPIWQWGKTSNNWWFSFSRQSNHNQKNLNYTKFYWLTEYPVAPAHLLRFKPTWADYSGANSSNYSNLGFGYRFEPNYGPEVTAMTYYYPNTPDTQWELELSLDWRIYQYYLSFSYLGRWTSGYNTDTLSLNVNRKFSLPIQKPFGTIIGQAYLDNNHNGLKDPDEPIVPQVAFCIDGNPAFKTNKNGNFELNSLIPGTHQIQLDEAYQVMYYLPQPSFSFEIEAYQQLHLDIPLLRTQNITGKVYFDQNNNQIFDGSDSELSGILLTLNGPDQTDVTQTRTAADGSFVFYQTNPAIYELSLELTDLPETYAPHDDYQPILVNTHTPDSNPELLIGLIPYEKPVEMVSELPPIFITAENELLSPGMTAKIAIESTSSLELLKLTLPDGSKVTLPCNQENRIWNYTWKVPANTPIGPITFQCSTTTVTGSKYETEIQLLIIN